MQAAVTPLAFPGDLPLSDAIWKAHKISPDERQVICERLGREPTYTELGVFSVMWSEHCSYKSSRSYLSQLPTKGPYVLQGPGENAGVVDVGDGIAAIFKIESHNHPSFIEPYQGAATGVGGILRDIFTMGARPIAGMNSLRFGSAEHPRTPELLRGVVAGIGGYGNCIGVPTVGGELFFHSRYDGNILVNAFACGVVRKDRIFYGRAEGVGNPVLYVGAPTGRDGIHGATMASDEFQKEGPSQRPTVQVGDPFMEKLLLEACLEIFSHDVLAGIQDMGAAGLTSSSVEMASRSGNGLDLDLDLIPRRAKHLSPYEILLSESQERMLLVAQRGKEDKILEICKKWDLDVAIIGHVTDTSHWVVRATPGYDPLDTAPISRNPQIVCDLPVDVLTEDAPRYQRPRAADTTLPARHAFPIADIIPHNVSFSEQLLTLAGSENVGSRQWVWRQYDSIVRGGTRVRPGSDAAVVCTEVSFPDGERSVSLAFSCDGNGRLADLDPYTGGALAVAEACRNLVVTGAEPMGLTDGLNFGSPENPVVMEQFARSLEGMGDACRALGVPIVSGNVSFYNETDGKPILPTPIITAVGKLQNPADLVPNHFVAEGHTIVLLGQSSSYDLGGSEYLSLWTKDVVGKPPTLDLFVEANLQALCLTLARNRKVVSMHDVSDGGLAIALAECCTSHEDENAVVGATVEIDVPNDMFSIAAHLFSEAPSRVIASLRPDDVDDVCAEATKRKVHCLVIGKTHGLELTIHSSQSKLPILNVPTRSLREKRTQCLENIVHTK